MERISPISDQTHGTPLGGLEELAKGASLAITASEVEVEPALLVELDVLRSVVRLCVVDDGLDNSLLEVGSTVVLVSDELLIVVDKTTI